MDKSSAYSAKGPGFTTRWRQEFININCMFCSFEKIKLQLGPTNKKNKKKKKQLEMSCFIRLNRCVLLQSLRRIYWKEGGLSLAQAVTHVQSKEHIPGSLDISFAQAILLAQNMEHTHWILSKIF